MGDANAWGKPGLKALHRAFAFVSPIDTNDEFAFYTELYKKKTQTVGVNRALVRKRRVQGWNYNSRY